MGGVPHHVKKKAVREFYDRKNRRGKYARPMSMPEDEHRMERERVWRDFLDERSIEPDHRGEEGEARQ